MLRTFLILFIFVAGSANAGAEQAKCGFSESVTYGTASPINYIHTDFDIPFENGFSHLSTSHSAKSDPSIKLKVELWESSRSLQFTIEDSSFESVPGAVSNRSCRDAKAGETLYLSYSKMVAPQPGTNIPGRLHVNLSCTCF